MLITIFNHQFALIVLVSKTFATATICLSNLGATYVCAQIKNGTLLQILTSLMRTI